MGCRIDDFCITKEKSIIEALKKIDTNEKGFLIVIDEGKKFLGVVTDGDIRRFIIKKGNIQDEIEKIYIKNAKKVYAGEGFEAITNLFKSRSIDFLPILDDNDVLINIITKKQMHAMMLLDIRADETYDFNSINTDVIDYEVYYKPWGFYKTTFFTDHYQGKILCVNPNEKISLQSHSHREERWAIVQGIGTVQLDESVFDVKCGSVIYIPKGCKHRISNVDEKVSLIISEVQIGDYLGEDDIVRYEDKYGRVDNK